MQPDISRKSQRHLKALKQQRSYSSLFDDYRILTLMQMHPTFHPTFNVRVEWNFKQNFEFWMKPDILICTLSSTMLYPTFYSSKVQKFIHSIIKNAGHNGHNHSNTFSVGWIDGFWWQKSPQRKLEKSMQSLFKSFPFFFVWILFFLLFPFLTSFS